MAASVIQSSFAAGEISRNLYGRVDLDKYHSGLAMCRNWFVDYRGGISTRPGTEFIFQTKFGGNGLTRLIPFIASTTASYVLEFGNYYLRVSSNGAPLLEAPVTVASVTADVSHALVNAPSHGYANGQQIFLSGLAGDFASLNNTMFSIELVDLDNFYLRDLFNNYVTTFGFVGSSAGEAAAPFELATPYTSGDLRKLKFIQSVDVMTITHNSYKVMELQRLSATNFSLNLFSVGPKIDAPTGLVAATSAAGNLNYGYQVTAVTGTGEEGLPSAASVVASYPLDPLGNPAGSPPVDPKNITLNWDPTPNADHYKIYKWGPIAVGSGLGSSYGLIGIAQRTDNTIVVTTTPSTTVETEFGPITIPGTTTVTQGASSTEFTDTNIAPDFTQQPPTHRDPFGLGNPSCVTYYQQRLVFGGITPVQMDFSKTGAYHNFDVSNNLLDSDAISISISARQVNTIKHMIPMASGLVVLTSGGAFHVSGGVGQAAITPTNATALPQASTGANDMPPIVVNYDILFVQSKGSLVRDLAYNFYLQTYYGFDRSVLANHLFFGRELVEWAYAEEPFKLIWCVRDDGILLTLTYVPEQEVYGWARHDTAGEFESVCAVPEGAEDAVYFVVRRQLNGQVIRMVERLASRKFLRVEDAWFVDSGLNNLSNRPDSILRFFTGDNGLNWTLVALAGPTFTNADVGKIIWLDGGGKLLIDGYHDNQTVFAATLTPPSNGVPDINPEVWNDVPAGEWELLPQLTQISGLAHLANSQVKVLADGMAFSTTVSSLGQVLLPSPASKVLVGLGFQAQAQTLYLDVEGGPTQQGKMKRVPACTVRVDNTRALKVGTDFNTMFLMKGEQPAGLYSTPVPLQTKDERIVLGGGWNGYGQVCIQQDEPLPATVLAVIPEVQLGDTQN